MADVINLNKLRTTSIKHRKSVVSIKNFSKAAPVRKDAVKNLFKLLPDINAGKNLKDLAALMARAKKKRRAVIFMFGAHVIKCGLAPLVIDLVRRGYITALATNGASLIHDFEIAYCGNTSEFVDEVLGSGSFGVTAETAAHVNGIASRAAGTNKGLGETAGKEINSLRLRHRDLSIFAQAYKYNVPVTVHVAIGTDVVHQHPSCDGAAWGAASYRDFLKFCSVVKGLNNGGVLLNFGSAVILPEVFLKAINICRNLGSKVDNFTAADFDMIKQYRPSTNIVRRPTAKNGHGYNFVGHHELMLPMLYLGLLGNE